MKKTYFAPASNLVVFEIEGMIAASQGGIDLGGDVTIEPGTGFSEEMSFDEVDSESDNYWE